MSGLYIHIPFCKQKCHYCDFHFSVSFRNKDKVLQAIHQEIFLRKNELKDEVQSIYFGGGTPSVLSVSELNTLFEQLYSHYNISKTAEITLEANPDDLHKDYIVALRKTPVNRLSIGVQSFFDTDLRFMNRAHTAKEALMRIPMVQDAGFENISVDLIYGIPGLTNKKWEQNLEQFNRLNIPHLSAYALTVETRTALAHFIKTQKVPPLDEAKSAMQFDMLRKELLAREFLHYEFSNFAKKGFIARHNTSYWQGKPYLGFGPSAHSFVGNIRSWNVAHNSKYYKKISLNELPSKSEFLTDSTRYNEYIMTGLRTMWGVDLQKISREFGEKYSDYLLRESKKYRDKGQLVLKESFLKIHENSLFLSDGIIADLFWVD